MSDWPCGRASIQLWPPGTHCTGARAAPANSAAAAPGVMAIETAPFGEDGHLLGHQGAYLAPLVDGHEEAADGQRLAGRADIAAHVGEDRPHGREHAADEEVREIAHDAAAARSTSGATFGANGATTVETTPCRSFQAGVLTPSR